MQGSNTFAGSYQMQANTFCKCYRFLHEYLQNEFILLIYLSPFSILEVFLVSTITAVAKQPNLHYMLPIGSRHSVETNSTILWLEHTE